MSLNKDSELYARVHELFRYENGKLIRKISVNGQAKAGQVAGYFNKSIGYFDVRVDGKCYRQHRIIFLMFNETLPELVDHIDGNPKNNVISNLRSATKAQNRWNCRPNTGSQSGVKGVYKDGSSWKALVNVNNVRYYLGMYKTIDEAKAVVEKKYLELHKDFMFKGDDNV